MSRRSAPRVIGRAVQLIDRYYVSACLAVVMFYPIHPLETAIGLAIALYYLVRRAKEKLYFLLILLAIPYIGSGTPIELLGCVLVILLAVFSALGRAISIPRCIGIAIVSILVGLALTKGIASWSSFVSSFYRWLEKGDEVLPLYLAIVLNLSTMIFYENVIERTIKKGRGVEIGAIPILFFIALLVSAAINLALGNEARANKLAELAYYSLIMGVAIQLVSVAREREDLERSRSPS